MGKEIEDAMNKDLPEDIKVQADIFYKLMHSYGFVSDDAKFIMYTAEQQAKIK